MRGYDLPAFVGPDSIAIAVSHSGNTEETVTAFEEAIDRGVKPVIVTTGGTLEGLATTHRAPLVTYTAEAKPRDALASMFTALVAIAHAVHVVGDVAATWTRRLRCSHRRGTSSGPRTGRQNPAKQLARQLVGRFPRSMAGRSSNRRADVEGETEWLREDDRASDVLPDVNHTSAVGYSFPPQIADDLAVVQLRSSYDHPRVRIHWQATTDLLTSAASRRVVDAEGRSRLAQVYWTLALADWAAYYLALLNGVDPTAEEAIAYMKRALA